MGFDKNLYANIVYIYNNTSSYFCIIHNKKNTTLIFSEFTVIFFYNLEVKTAEYLKRKVNFGKADFGKAGYIFLSNNKQCRNFYIFLF